MLLGYNTLFGVSSNLVEGLWAALLLKFYIIVYYILNKVEVSYYLHDKGDYTMSNIKPKVAMYEFEESDGLPYKKNSVMAIYCDDDGKIYHSTPMGYSDFKDFCGTMLDICVENEAASKSIPETVSKEIANCKKPSVSPMVFAKGPGPDGEEVFQRAMMIDIEDTNSEVGTGYPVSIVEDKANGCLNAEVYGKDGNLYNGRLDRPCFVGTNDKCWGVFVPFSASIPSLNYSIDFLTDFYNRKYDKAMELIDQGKPPLPYCGMVLPEM